VGAEFRQHDLAQPAGQRQYQLLMGKLVAHSVVPRPAPAECHVRAAPVASAIIAP
jgi:hypothetical protein